MPTCLLSKFSILLPKIRISRVALLVNSWSMLLLQIICLLLSILDWTDVAQWSIRSFTSDNALPNDVYREISGWRLLISINDKANYLIFSRQNNLCYLEMRLFPQDLQQPSFSRYHGKKEFCCAMITVIHYKQSVCANKIIVSWLKKYSSQ